MSSASHSWSPITDLTTDELAAASDELPALVATWQEQRVLMDPRQVERFNERLAREWAIETGIIERIYTLDRGTTQLLIERGIDSSLIPYGESDQSPELVAGIISDQQSAVDWLFDTVKAERPLSTSFVRELHALMTRRQEWVDGIDQFGKATRTALRHGQYKDTPNNPSRGDGPVHEYCPPVHVAAEMDRLVELHLEHRASGVPPEVEAAWLHRRFTQIHPFQDGNGRVARALASLVLIQAGWFPLVVTRDDRIRYLDALEAADQGDLTPLVALFSSLQKRSLVRALTITSDVMEAPAHVDQMIDAIADRLAERDRVATTDQTRTTARQLWQVARVRLDAVAVELRQRIADARPRVVIESSADAEGELVGGMTAATTLIADGLGYPANTEAFHHWVRLIVWLDNRSAWILVSLQAIGPDDRGLGGGIAGYADGRTALPIPLSREAFEYTSKEDPESVEQRFRAWLEEAILLGLDTWRRSL